MTTFLIALLAVFAVVLCTGREPDENARTWSELWAPARSKGWKRGFILGVGGTLKLLLLLAGGVTVLALQTASTSGRGISLLCGALAWHLAAVTAYAATPPPQLSARVVEPA